MQGMGAVLPWFSAWIENELDMTKLWRFNEHYAKPDFEREKEFGFLFMYVKGRD
jgi:hypothetical protein